MADPSPAARRSRPPPTVPLLQSSRVESASPSGSAGGVAGSTSSCTAPSSGSRWPVLAPARDAPSPAGPVPAFSVLVPAYQAAETIGEALESALSQTLPAREVIVCDDGSTDDITSAVAPYRDRITFLSKANGGGASALNAA